MIKINLMPKKQIPIEKKSLIQLSNGVIGLLKLNVYHLKEANRKLGL